METAAAGTVTVVVAKAELASALVDPVQPVKMEPLAGVLAVMDKTVPAA